MQSKCNHLLFPPLYIRMGEARETHNKFQTVSVSLFFATFFSPRILFISPKAFLQVSLVKHLSSHSLFVEYLLIQYSRFIIHRLFIWSQRYFEFLFFFNTTRVSESNTATASSFTLTSTHSCERHHWSNRSHHTYIRRATWNSFKVNTKRYQSIYYLTNFFLIF